jgi:hypothetical protein
MFLYLLAQTWMFTLSSVHLNALGNLAIHFLVIFKDVGPLPRYAFNNLTAKLRVKFAAL